MKMNLAMIQQGQGTKSKESMISLDKYIWARAWRSYVSLMQYKVNRHITNNRR